MTSREQNLAIVLVTILIGGGTAFGFAKLKQWKQTIDDDERTLEMRRIEADDLLAQRDMWDKRSQWLSTQAPAFSSRADSETELDSLIDRTAKAHNLEVRQNQLSEFYDQPTMKAASAQVVLHGSPGDLGRWLYELQQPSAFIKIPAIVVTPDEDEPEKGNVNISLNIEKWYRVNPS